LARLGTWLTITAIAAALTVPADAQRTAQRPVVQAPDGPVRNIIIKNCTACHGIDDYAFYAMDRGGWQELLDTKHKQRRGIVLSTNDEKILLDYLVEEFGPDSTPFPRSYIPPEITTFFENDDDARAFMQQACTTCHSVDRVFDSRYPQQRWRAIVVDMRERGAKFSDEDLERLVEWLGRVRGTNQVP
jgi:cytochrome c553